MCADPDIKLLVRSALPDEIRSTTDGQPANESSAEGETAAAAGADASQEGAGAQTQPLMTHENKMDFLDEINLEIALHFAQLYVLVETGRGEPELGDELSEWSGRRDRCAQTRLSGSSIILRLWQCPSIRLCQSFSSVWWLA